MINDLILNNKKIIPRRVLWIDLGVKVPVIICLNDNKSIFHFILQRFIRGHLHHNKKRVYKKITNDDTMTWKKFKQQRYELMENSLDTIPYIDADKLVQDYVDALKVDASNEDRNVTVSTNVRRINYHYLKRVTNDFREAVLTGKNDVIHISTPEEFKEKIMQNKIENVNF